MSGWERTTPWKQGAFIDSAMATAMGLINDAQKAIVIISHDCDIAQNPDVEPDLEIIVGEFKSEMNGSYSSAKNPRVLHLNVQNDNESVVIEFNCSNKSTIKKADLADKVPCALVSMPATAKQTFQRWLASRYHRSSFPDEFDRRLSATKLGDKIKQRLSKHNEHIRAIFVDVDSGEEINRATGDGNPYGLKIVLVYDTTKDVDVAHAAARKACDEIIKDFETKCLKEGVWTEFHLEACVPMADTSFTFLHSQTLKRWTMDAISLRDQTPIAND